MKQSRVHNGSISLSVYGSPPVFMWRGGRKIWKVAYLQPSSTWTVQSKGLAQTMG
jgi:hypothetical protein